MFARPAESRPSRYNIVKTELGKFRTIIHQVIAFEAAHEISGMLTCDRRLPLSVLKETFPAVDFSLITDEVAFLCIWLTFSVIIFSNHTSIFIKPTDQTRTYACTVHLH